MSQFQTTAFAAHGWLVANVPTATGLQTFDRLPMQSTIPDSFVVVGKIEKLTQEWAGFGNGRRDERYDINGFVRVWVGDDPNTVNTETLASQAWAYVDDIVELISLGGSVAGLTGDPTLGGNVIFAEFAQADELDVGPTNQGGLEIGVEFTITCRAQVER